MSQYIRYIVLGTIMHQQIMLWMDELSVSVYAFSLSNFITERTLWAYLK